MSNSGHYPVTRGWRKTIRLKHLLSDDDSAENARKVAGQFAAILKRQPEYAEDTEFGYLVDEFELLAESDDGTCADFNELLAGLYDWADAERVWIGGTR